MRFERAITLSGIDAHPLRAPAADGPTMALGNMPTRPALLLRAVDRDGVAGWGEVWANFPPRANLHKAHLIEDVIAPQLAGFTFTEPQEVTDYLRAALSTYFLHAGQSRVFEHLLAGLDCALWDLALRAAGRSFAAYVGLGADAAAAVYASSINRGDLACMARHAGGGQSLFKLKLGFDDDVGRAFVADAAAALPAGARLALDANQSWDVHRAEAMLQSLEEFAPRFAEEPIRADADAADWARLARATVIPLAAGENLYGADEFLRAAAAGVAIVQPDVAKWGGITGALALADALPAGVRLWPHFMGGAVGQVAALSVAAAVESMLECGDGDGDGDGDDVGDGDGDGVDGGDGDGDESVCELDVNPNPLRDALCGDLFTVTDGRIKLPESPGLTPPPLAERLAEYRDADA